MDDEPQFGDLVADFVERKSEQIEVTTKRHPAEALDFLEDAVEEIDCVVSDYDMPGKNGLEFLNAVRDITSDLPFILLLRRARRKSRVMLSRRALRSICKKRVELTSILC
ncbi:response regulator [Haloplanus halobius]|uniref:response regulator n=1 Tax=Haloplanus halobius TaxID=2934938 RepID=UPI00200BF433